MDDLDDAYGLVRRPARLDRREVSDGEILHLLKLPAVASEGFLDGLNLGPEVEPVKELEDADKHPLRPYGAADLAQRIASFAEDGNFGAMFAEEISRWRIVIQRL